MQRNRQTDRRTDGQKEPGSEPLRYVCVAGAGETLFGEFTCLQIPQDREISPDARLIPGLPWKTHGASTENTIVKSFIISWICTEES